MKRILFLTVSVILTMFLLAGTVAFAAEDALLGDVNKDGECTVEDALLILCAVLDDQEFLDGDINGDGEVGLVDVIRTLHLTMLDTYTVTFYDSDGTTVLYTDVVYAGEDATPPAAPQKDGYRFDGWEGNYVAVKQDELVYAKYIRQCTVTFVDHDGTVLKSETVDAGTSVTAPEIPYHEGYRFDGWDGEYSDVAADATVTAKCVRYYVISFIDYDGTIIGLQELDEGTAISIPDDPTRNNYRFIGWDTNVTTATEDVTVTAQYIRQYTVTFVDHDGTVLKSETVDAGASATAPTGMYFEGYTFSGWDKAFDAVETNLTVIAQYEIKEYTVKLWTHDKTTLLDEQTVVHGSRFEPIEHSEKFPEMYFDWEACVMRCFSGWSVTDAIVGDTDVYAEYEAFYNQPVIAASKNGSDLRVVVYVPASMYLYGIDFGFSWDASIGVSGYKVPSNSGTLYTGCDYEVCAWGADFNNKTNTFEYSWICGNGHGAKNMYVDVLSAITFEESDGDTLIKTNLDFAEDCRLVFSNAQGVDTESLVSITPLIVMK